MSENKNCIISKEKILNSFTVSKIIYTSSDIDNSKGYLADISIPWCINGTEEKAYEIYRDLIESTLGDPITVIVNFDSAYEEKLRALLLAAIYGRVDLLIGNVISKKEIIQSLQDFHKVFCELESDKKEFNGYIKIGVLVDSPCLLLDDLTSITRIDFLTLNAERITTLMCGGKKNIPRDAMHLIGKYINKFCKTHASKDINVCAGERTLSNSFMEMYAQNNICNIFCEELPFS